MIIGPPRLVQSLEAVVVNDSTLTSPTFADLTDLSVTFTKRYGNLEVWVTMMCSSSTAADNVIRIVDENTAVYGHGAQRCYVANALFAIMAKAFITTLAPGSHTIKVQWRPGSGTIRCRPTTAAVGKEFGRLSVLEVAAQ